MDNGLRILLLAPQPFYQERGTPIAVNLVLKVLSERGNQVDVVTFHEGMEVTYDGVTVHRTIKIPFIRHIRPGFSWKKVICDVFMFAKAIRLVSKKRYQLVHAVEEAVFIALILKWLYKVPYIYDMDSSLSQQMLERYPLLRPFRPLFNYCEGLAVRNAKAVIPVCDALAGIIQKYNPEKVVVLQDVSLFKEIGS